MINQRTRKLFQLPSSFVYLPYVQLLVGYVLLVGVNSFLISSSSLSSYKSTTTSHCYYAISHTVPKLKTLNIYEALNTCTSSRGHIQLSTKLYVTEQSLTNEQPPTDSSKSTDNDSINTDFEELNVDGDAIVNTFNSSSTFYHDNQDSIHVNSSSSTELSLAETTTLYNDEVPIASYQSIIIFAASTTLIWLSEPLLSLVDTTIVGKFASHLTTTSAASTTAAASNIISLETIQLAALGPATMLCDNAFYLTYFLAIATTNQLATALATKNSKKLIQTTSHALGVASILGLIISLLLHFSGDSLLQFIVGKEGAVVHGIDMTQSVIHSAWQYVKIRGYVAPLSVMGCVAQSVSLATLDTKTPTLAVVVASVINIVGDWLLVAKWRMGLSGAALATALASMLSSLVLLVETRKKVLGWRGGEGGVMKGVSSNVEQNRQPKSLDRDSIFENQDDINSIPLISLPDTKSFLSLVKLAGPIFFVIVGKLICYSSMTLKASDFGMLSLATHTIMIRIFFYYCTFGDSFSQAAQSFLPAVLYRKAKTRNKNGSDGNDLVKSSSTNTSTKTTSQQQQKHINTKNANILLRRILVLSSSIAIINSVGSKIILQTCGIFFTNDRTIHSLLKLPSNIFYLGGSVLLHPIIMALEGTILASRDLKFLVMSYGGTMAFMLLLLKFASPAFECVWRALFIFQLIRCTSFGSRVFRKSRKGYTEP